MKTIAVCVNHRGKGRISCAARGSESLVLALETQAALCPEIRILRLPCMGACEAGPNIKIVGGDMYHAVDQSMLALILNEAKAG